MQPTLRWIAPVRAGRRWAANAVGAICLGLLLVAGELRAVEPTLMIQGKRQFWTGWYTHSPQAGQGTAYLQEPPTTGCEFVMPYDIWTQPGGLSDVLAVLNLAQANGIRILMHGVWSADPWILSQRINAVKNHPALAGYFLYDEPELDGTTPQQLLQRYNDIKALDSNPAHPIVTVFTSYIIQEKGDRITPYLPATDIQALDCYMVHNDEAELQPDLAMIAVETILGVARGQATGEQGFLIVPPAMQGGAGRGYRMPTYKEFRYLSYAPITYGAGGVWPWVFGQWGDFGNTAPQRAASVTPVFNEIDAIKPCLVMPSTGLSSSSTAGDIATSNAYGTTYGLKRVSHVVRGGATNAVLIATNNTTTTQAAVDLHVSGLHAQVTLASAMGESRVIPIVNGSFVDAFTGPYSVHVYRLTVPRADRAVDLVLHRPSNGQFFSGWTDRSSGFALSFEEGSEVQFGSPEDRALTGDVNGDGVDDLVLYNTVTGRWAAGLTAPDGTMTSSGSQVTVTPVAGDVPLVGDLNGDGRTDVLLYRPSSGHWFSGLTTSAGQLAWGSGSIAFGNPDYDPLVGDVNGDGRDDLVLHNHTNGRWLVGFTGSGGALSPVGSDLFGPFLAGDVARLGDVNGDGRADLLIYRPSNGQWISGLTAAGGVLTSNGSTLQFGTVDYDPLVGDVNADGRDDLLIYNRLTGRWLSGLSAAGGVLTSMGSEVYGPLLAGDVPLVAHMGVDPAPRLACQVPAVDSDGDGDVDQQDFGAFQVCLSGPGVATGEGCACFDGDAGSGDGDVDADDLTRFLTCVSGPEIPADLDCDQAN